MCYKDGIGVEPNFDLAFKWCQKSAENDYDYAQYQLALFYKEDKTLPFADNKMEYWFAKAHKQGFAPATCELGECYLNGIGVNKNTDEAIKLFNLASEQGYVHANYKLGEC